MLAAHATTELSDAKKDAVARSVYSSPWPSQHFLPGEHLATSAAEQVPCSACSLYRIGNMEEKPNTAPPITNTADPPIATDAYRTALRTTGCGPMVASQWAQREVLDRTLDFNDWLGLYVVVVRLRGSSQVCVLLRGCAHSRRHPSSNQDSGGFDGSFRPPFVS